MHIAVVENIQQGVQRAKEEVYKKIDSKTVLFLSGGKTPEPLYDVLAEEGEIKPATVAMIDERFGKPMHANSNEKMIAETGLLRYFKARSIPFYSILQGDSEFYPRHPELARLAAKRVRHDNRKEIAQAYDETVRNLFFHFPKSIGILGIGADGHTAGIPTKNLEQRTENSEIYETHDYVSHYNDASGKYGERITMTFAGLSLLDFCIVLIFGKDKKKALQQTFTSGTIEEIPARFYAQPSILEKTLFITDQRI